ncbi:MAG: GSU2403 family nucleotidyltransferase fold protein [Elusimicrobiota bacterium]
MAKANASDFDLLIKVVRDLEDFLPHLVLIGGWVPTLYVHFLWKEIMQEPLMTMDIDFGLRNMVFTGKETISQRVTNKHYGEHHLELGKEIPFVPVVKSNKGARAELDFIIDEKTPNDIRQKLMGREIYVSALPFVDVLLENTIPIKLSEILVNIPNPVQYVFHKLLTFTERTPGVKKGKDLYYVYFVLRFHPDGDTFLKTVSRLIRDHPLGKTVKKNIRTYFRDAFSDGPTLIDEATKISSLTALGTNIREDALKRIRDL